MLTESTITLKVLIIYQKDTKSRYQNPFLNFQKFEKFENEKVFPKSCFLLLIRLTLYSLKTLYSKIRNALWF